MLDRFQRAIAWRIRRVFGDARIDRMFVRSAKVWRPLMGKPIFIGISGSAGKTTTKELVARVLSRNGRVIATRESLNVLPEVAKLILRVRPWHEYCVAELSEDKPGALDHPLKLFTPSIGVVTVIGHDHWSAFNSKEAIAEEVGKLVAALPENGTAILNADDPLVAAMATKSDARIVTYGISQGADLRAENVLSRWPAPLEMTLTFGTERVALSTQLCGIHWTPSVLGAIGAGLASGMKLAECAAEVSHSPAFEGRMQPVIRPDGVTFIRDDWKAPLWTVDSCLDFMQEARSNRKIVVIGTLSDCGAGAPEKYVKVARRAQEVADLTVFVGPWASQVLKARQPGHEEALKVFRNVRDAARFIKETQTAGDLILLKGTNKQDHLIRMIMACDDDVACWRDDCDLHLYCSECPAKDTPSGLPLLVESNPAGQCEPVSVQDSLEPVQPGDMVIIGLGNPEDRYRNTPHNVGYEVIDRLACTIGASWVDASQAWVANGSHHGKVVHLLKINSAMNLIGGGLRQIAAAMSFSHEQCILAFDDLDMAIGAVRMRLGGGAGGHRGVASILEAFQTDRFQRVKIGVGKPGEMADRVEYVLTPFDEESRKVIDETIVVAEQKILEMIRK